MIIINTTFIIDASILKDILYWITNSYVASAVHSSALENKTLLTKILNHSEDSSENYAVQLWFNDMNHAVRWDNSLGSRLRMKLTERWGQKVLTFHTYMEVKE